MRNYYADWSNWLPVMEAYEARRAAYFGTPAVNLIAALNVSLGQILEEDMEARFARHARISRACKAGIAALGLGQVPSSDDVAAVTMTAPRYPSGVSGPEFLAKVKLLASPWRGGFTRSTRVSISALAIWKCGRRATSWPHLVRSNRDWQPVATPSSTVPGVAAAMAVLIS